MIAAKAVVGMSRRRVESRSSFLRDMFVVLFRLLQRLGLKTREEGENAFSPSQLAL